MMHSMHISYYQLFYLRLKEELSTSINKHELRQNEFFNLDRYSVEFHNQFFLRS
jgi:hypothetical protein